MWSLLRGSLLPWDHLPAKERNAIEIIVNAREDLYEKILAALSVGENTDISVMFKADPKTSLWCGWVGG